MIAATPARGTARLWIATLALTLVAAPLSAQCVIDGPPALCNGSAQLCGPSGSYLYTWSGPDGSLQNTQCITATLPGTYTLSLIDTQAQRFVGMCSTTLAAGSTPPTPTIDGPATACADESVTLCGPDLGFGYLWTGPSGTATTRCVTATGPGTWTLSLVDLASGCTGAAATHEIAGELCNAFSACPRPPSFWARGCRKPERFRYSPVQMASFAGCVDECSAVLAWESPLEGLCRTLNPPSPSLRDRAWRQLAGVWMNVCSFDSREMPSQGTAVGLDASSSFTTEAGPTTVASWLAAAESRMLELASQSLEQRSVREAYRAVLRQAWKLNHAEGLDGPCAADPPAIEPARLAPTGDEIDVEESLDTQMMWELERGALVLHRPAPNPMVQSAAIAFTVGGASPMEVSVAVYDLAGRRVAEIASGLMPPGRHSAQWNGRDDDGQPVRRGVYFVRARAGAMETRAMLTVVR